MRRYKLVVDYNSDCSCNMEHDEKGKYVEYDDVKEEIEKIKKFIFDTANESEDNSEREGLSLAVSIIRDYLGANFSK